MDDTEFVSHLIGDIYDAALDPDRWPVVLERLCGFMPGAMAMLFSVDAASKLPRRQVSWGMDPHYFSLYMKTYGRMNPTFPRGLFFPVGEVYSQADMISHEEMRETRFYAEWLKPQGYIDVVGCIVEKSATSCAPLAVIRHERDGYTDEPTRRRMALVAPHVRRAVLIGDVIDLHKIEAAGLADALDGLAAGMFLVDAGGRIVHANTSGHAMLSAAAVVRVADGRLVASDPAANRALKDIFSAAAAGDAAIGVKGVAVPLPARIGEEHVAHVLPLTSAARRQAGVTYAAVAAVFVQKAKLNLESPLEGVSRRFQLTAGEVRVLFAIISIGSVAEASEALGIAEGTVRNHLHHLFEKTGTTRQAELVKLVGGFTSPLIQ
jgi:DNA-binding CsgD family transcriptional regulator